MTTLKFTITGYWEADYSHYELDEEDAVQMANLDQEEYDEGGVSVYDVLDWAIDRDITVRIEPA